MSYPNCPNCGSEYTYEDGNMYVCPMCQHEWSQDAPTEESNEIVDAFGNVLSEGDSITVIKDIKVKGARQPLKQGTNIKNIRFRDAEENIICKVDGFGTLYLKSELVKKI